VARSKVADLLSTGEVVLIETRQHWMAAVRYALKPILLVLAIFALFFLNQLLDFNEEGLFSFINDVLRWIIGIMIIVAVVWLPIDLIQWDTRRFVLTNRRSIRMQGLLRRTTFDSSLEQINDIGVVETTLGRYLGYSDLTLLTASDAANETYEQLLDGLQYKKAVLDAKEGIRMGAPLTGLPEGFVVKGGTNEASRRADGKIEDVAEAATPEGAAPGAGEQPPLEQTQPAPPPPLEQTLSAPPPSPVVNAESPSEPRPGVEPVAMPSAPAAVADPALVAASEPALEPEPASAPEADFQPEPAAFEPAPEPEPVSAPEADFQPEPAAFEPALEPEPEPAPEPESASAPEADFQPEPEPTDKPTSV
jgi:hypothetical protein